MFRRLHSLKFLAIGLGLAVALGPAAEAPSQVGGRQLLLGTDSAVTAQQESTAGFRELAACRAVNFARFHPAPAPTASTESAPLFLLAALSAQAPVAGSGPFGDRPFLSACPPQGPPSLA